MAIQVYLTRCLQCIIPCLHIDTIRICQVIKTLNNVNGFVLFELLVLLGPDLKLLLVDFSLSPPAILSMAICCLIACDKYNESHQQSKPISLNRHNLSFSELQ